MMWCSLVEPFTHRVSAGLRVTFFCSTGTAVHECTVFCPLPPPPTPFTLITQKHLRARFSTGGDESTVGIVVSEARYSPLCSAHAIARRSEAEERRDGAGASSFTSLMPYRHTCLAQALDAVRLMSSERAAAAPCTLHFLTPAEQASSRDVPAVIEAAAAQPGSARVGFEGSKHLTLCRGKGCSARGDIKTGGDNNGGESSTHKQTATLLGALRAGRHIVQSAFPAAVRVASKRTAELTSQPPPERNPPVQTVSPAIQNAAIQGKEQTDSTPALLERLTAPLADVGAQRRRRRRRKAERQEQQMAIEPSAPQESLLPEADAGSPYEAVADASSSSSSSSVLLEAASASTSSAAAGAAFASMVPGLTKLMSPIIDGLLKPVVGIVGGVIGDVLTESFGNVLASSVDSGLTSEIVSQLTHALTTGLTESVVPPMTETITDAVTHSVPPALRDAVTAQVSQRLAASLTASLSETLTQTVSAELVREVPGRLSEDLSASLTYILTQSVTQSVVPALTHVLHHNPAEDFYCAYCEHHQLYCDLCRRGGPEQLQRAHYYAAYYSRHYANAFSGFTSPEGTGEAASPPQPPPPSEGGGDATAEGAPPAPS
jgi:hypothetical protein